MSRPNVTIRVSPSSADHDRAVHRLCADCSLVVLADGAGGTSGGRDAADRVVQNARESIEGPEQCVSELQRLDRLLYDASSGEMTAILLVVRDRQLYGASVGDSGVLALATEASFDLTKDQHRGPLLGNGAARPVGFGPFHFNDRILVASDGLLKYVCESRIRMIATFGPLAAAADELVEAARLPSGSLQDDLAIVLLDPAGAASRAPE